MAESRADQEEVIPWAGAKISLEMRTKETDAEIPEEQSNAEALLFQTTFSNI